MQAGVPVFADEREMKRNVRNAMMKTRYNVHELWRQWTLLLFFNVYVWASLSIATG